MKKLIVFIIFALSVSCVSNRSLYYWGDYSDSLYQLKKEPGEETQAAHKKNLEDIFEQSEKLKKKVAPGLMCEYGYILLQLGQKDEGLKYFELEVVNYPESQQFVSQLLSQINGSEE